MELGGAAGSGVVDSLGGATINFSPLAPGLRYIEGNGIPA